MNKKHRDFIKRRKLLDRIYDMLLYLGAIKDFNQESSFKSFFKNNLNDIEYIESLAKYFDDKLKKNIQNIELKCNLSDLITDLDYLKQYLSNC